MYRYLFAILGIICSGATIAQESIQSCSPDLLTATIPNLPDYFAIEPENIQDQLSETYGCNFDTPPTLGFHTAEDKPAGTVKGILTAFTSGAFGTDNPSVTDYWLVEDSSDGQVYAIQGKGADIRIGKDDNPYLKWKESGSSMMALYNPVKPVDGFALYGPDISKFKADNQTMLSFASLNAKLDIPERYWITFKSKPEGAQLWLGNTYVAKTTILLDTAYGLVDNYRFVLTGFKDCLASEAERSNGLIPSRFSIYCVLTPK